MVVVDVGGATTDVHSVVDLDPEDAHTEGGLAREVVASTPVTRTVEGDLGMRWSAVSTVAEAGLDDLAEAARRRRDDPALLPDDDAEADIDEAIARAAVGLALRRHAGRSRVVVSPEGRVVERTGKDLREVDLLVGSGGVLRNGRPGVVDRIFAGSTGAHVEGGWQLPRAPRVVVDDEHVLAAIGLLATEHPATAYALSAGLRGGPRVLPRTSLSGCPTTPRTATRPPSPRRRRGARVPPLLRPHAGPADLDPAGLVPGRTGRPVGRSRSWSPVAPPTSRAPRCRGASTWRPPGAGGSW